MKNLGIYYGATLLDETDLVESKNKNRIILEYYKNKKRSIKILKAEIGINPNNDGKVIRLAFPELTEERRKELVKDIRKMGEESKVSVRAVRREGMDIAKAEQKDGGMTEDELKSMEDKIQKLTDKKVAEIDQMIENKEKEVMSV